MSSSFQRLATSVLRPADEQTTIYASRDHLSQEKPSQAWLEVFGPAPFKPAPGESYMDFRGRKIDYLQHVRHWDNAFQVLPNEDNAFERLLAYYHLPLTRVACAFKTNDATKAEERYVFLTVPGFEFFPTSARADSLIIWGQARLIKAGFVLKNVYPNPGLELLHAELVERLEEQAGEDA